jgi:hypothetical protein
MASAATRNAPLRYLDLGDFSHHDIAGRCAGREEVKHLPASHSEVFRQVCRNQCGRAVSGYDRRRAGSRLFAGASVSTYFVTALVPNTWHLARRERAPMHKNIALAIGGPDEAIVSIETPKRNRAFGSTVRRHFISIVFDKLKAWSSSCSSSPLAMRSSTYCAQTESMVRGFIASCRSSSSGFGSTSVGIGSRHASDK